MVCPPKKLVTERRLVCFVVSPKTNLPSESRSRRQSNSELNRLDLLSEFEQGLGSLAPPRIFPYSSRRPGASQGMIRRPFSTIPPTQSARSPRNAGTRRRSNRRRRRQSAGSQLLCHHRAALREPLKHRQQSHQQSHRSAERGASNRNGYARWNTKNAVR